MREAAHALAERDAEFGEERSSDSCARRAASSGVQHQTSE
jgi:hypothetical protein